MKLLFATNNRNKVSEVNQLLGNHIDIITPQDLGITDDIEETGATFEENARLKVDGYLQYFKGNIFSEDTGLEVEALNNEPGIYTARYAKVNATAEENMLKLLAALKGQNNRTARFKTIICLRWKDEIFYFEGICNGKIALAQSGNEGFGYDPIFIPDGYEQSFADLGMEVKKELSHRAIAIHKMVGFLKEQLK